MCVLIQTQLEIIIFVYAELTLELTLTYILWAKHFDYLYNILSERAN